MGGMSTLESHPWWSKSTAADNFQELGPPGRYHYEMYHINVDSWFICVYSGFFFSLLYLGASGTTSFATFISSILWAFDSERSLHDVFDSFRRHVHDHVQIGEWLVVF